MMRADTAATGTGGLRLGAGSVPDRSASHLALWNTTAFVGLRPGGAERRVAVDHRTDDGRLVGTWAGVIEGGVWVSGWSAPFGGIDLCRDHETVGEVMALVVAGRPNKLIADALAISVRTIEVHRARLFEKMGVHSAVELANLLRESG